MPENKNQPSDEAVAHRIAKQIYDQKDKGAYKGAYTVLHPDKVQNAYSEEQKREQDSAVLDEYRKAKIADGTKAAAMTKEFDAARERITLENTGKSLGKKFLENLKNALDNPEPKGMDKPVGKMDNPEPKGAAKDSEGNNYSLGRKEQRIAVIIGDNGDEPVIAGQKADPTGKDLGNLTSPLLPSEAKGPGKGTGGIKR